MPESFDPYHVWLGIPPEEQPANHYRLLGLRAFESNADVITNALDQRRAHLRSVQAGKRGALSQQLLNEVSAAGVCLLDAAKKKQYDEALRAKLMPAQAAVRPANSPGAAAAPVLLARIIPDGKTPGTPAANTAGPTRPAQNRPGTGQPIVVASPFTAPASAADPLATPPTRNSQAIPASRLALIAGIAGGAMLLLLLLVGAGAWLMVRRLRPSQIVPVPPAASPAANRGMVPPPVTSPSASTGAPWTPAAPAFPEILSVPPSPPPPPAARPQTTGAPRYALVFTGRETVDVPLPSDLQQPGTSCTIEMWLRWDPYEPAGRLFGAGPVGAYCRPAIGAGFNRIYLLARGTSSVRSSSFQGGKWQHVAITQDPAANRLFVDGKLELQTVVGRELNLESPLTLGNVSTSLAPRISPAIPYFSGLIRDLRVSRGSRYSGNFTPENRFAQDSQTAVLLDLNQPREWRKTIDNLTGQSPPAELNETRRIRLSPEGDVAAELPGGSVDLLRAFSIDDHGLEQSGTTLQTPTESWADTGSATGRSRYLIPVRPPAEYDADVELTRLEGKGGAVIGLEIAGQPAIVVLGAYPQSGGRTGLLTTNLSPTPSLLTAGVRQTFTIAVRLNGAAYDVSIADRNNVIARTNGNILQLRSPPDFAIPINHGMSFGSIDAKIRFHKLLLRPVNATFSPETLAVMTSLKRPVLLSPLAKNNSPPPGFLVPLPAPPPAPSSAPSPPESPPIAAGRLPVPAGEKLAAAVDAARKIYDPRIKQANQPAQKEAVAREIEKAAGQTQNDPVARYALYDLARKVYVQAGSVFPAINTAKRLELEYDLAPQDLVLATVDGLENTSLPLSQRMDLAREAADLADAALDSGLFVPADRISAAAAKSAARLRDADVRKDITQRRGAIQRICKEWSAVQTSLEKLKADPQDAAANLAVGKFLCLTFEDFDRGVSHLVASGDAALASPAAADAAAQRGDAQQRLTAANAWQQAAAKIADRDDKLAVQRRERWFLQQAVGDLAGIDKLKANKRIVDLDSIGPARVRTLGVVLAVTTPAETGQQRDAPTLIIFNSHNRQYRDRGVQACEILLLRRGAAVYRAPIPNLPWQEDSNPSLRVPLPTTDFDTVRIEIKSWHGMGGGLAEVKLLINGKNVLLGKPVRASGKYEPETLGRWLPTMINDSIVDEDNKASEGEGYWLLPNETPGWIEVSL